MARTRIRRTKTPARGRAVARRPLEVDLGPLPDLIGFMLRRAQIAVFKEIFRLFSQVDIRPAQFSVLTVIERNPGLTQSKVSAALGIKRTNFVALLDGLEQRGLATRRKAFGDRRSHALHLTEDGKAVMRRLRQLVEIQERRLIGRIGENRRAQLIDLLHRLIDGRRVPARATKPGGTRATAFGIAVKPGVRAPARRRGVRPRQTAP
jgi:DNA-binding MarR family transcriptional regulator